MGENITAGRLKHMIVLLNAAVMPTEGVYTLKQISITQFQDLLQQAAETGNLRSYIGYPETAEMIQRVTGIAVDVNRHQAVLTTGDVMLIVKLRHRVADAACKEKLQPSMNQFDFYHCNWHPLPKGGNSQ